jgi:hypothetical protein
MPGDLPLGYLRTLLTQVSEDLRAQIGTNPTASNHQQPKRSPGEDQAAGAWVVGSLILRHLGTHAPPLPVTATETPRDWLLRQFDRVAATVPGARLFRPGEDPLFDIMVSEETARALHEVATGRDSDLPRLTAAGDDGLLGDVYQDVVGRTDREHALIQTPAFVVEGILDLALKPAMAGLGTSPVRVMDPVCGSGEFLVRAFHRILAAIRSEKPGLPPPAAVKLALASVHGMDINPVAVTIARFRLLLAAMSAAGEATLQDVVHHDWTVNVRTGDSLLDLDTEAGAYDVVVGNPPYVVPGDKYLDGLYRSRYTAAQGRYSLAVPFVQLFLRLARQGDADTAGRIALLCANSFAKRQFGRALVEDIFRHEATITHVIDTAGAFIPGHGMPTVILVARHRVSDPADRVFAVLGGRGEPRPPDDAAKGFVWQSIGRSLQTLGHHDQWTTSTTLDHRQVTTFPWSFAVGDTALVLEKLSSARRLGSSVARVGYQASIGAEEIFSASRESFERDRTEPAAIVPMVSGENVRDWTVSVERYAFLPRQRAGGDDQSSSAGHLRRIWPYQIVLSHRATFSGKTYEQEGRPWFSWHQPPVSLGDRELIVYSAIGTTPHFALLPHGAVAMPSAPVIDGVDGLMAVELVALLNTSTICFWLKQNSMAKGQPNADQTAGEGEPWEARYQFLPGQIRDIPLPPPGITAYASELSELAEELPHHTPQAMLAGDSFDQESFRVARSRWNDIRSRMIALAEELDWHTYVRFGLCEASLVSSSPIHQLAPGERAFEIHHARDLAEKRESSRWFDRHNATAHIELPSKWPADYRRVVADRLEAIRKDGRLAVLEQPANKRRWITPGWDTMARAAIEKWILDRCERTVLESRKSPRLWTAEEIANILQADGSLMEAAAVLAPDRECTETFAKIIMENQVPVLAALRYRAKAMPKWQEWRAVWRIQAQNHASMHETSSEQITGPPKYAAADFLQPAYWRHRGKYDIPREVFFSSPTPKGLMFGCARWTPGERMQALTNALGTQEEIGQSDDARVPLLAGIRETAAQERIPPPSREPLDSTLLGIVAFWEREIGVTENDLRAWLPPPPRRGRPRRHP